MKRKTGTAQLMYRVGGMSDLTERLRRRYFGQTVHPYKRFERLVAEHLTPAATLLDAGCGRTAPVLASFRGRAKRLVGVDVVEFDGAPPDVELIRGTAERIDLPDASVDLLMSRSVLEHLDHPEVVFREFSRLLKPGGTLVFLTPNRWDYVSVIASAVPNRYHSWLVSQTEGRDEADVFPTRYRANTKRALGRLTREAGLSLSSLEYLGQEPAYLRFNPIVYLAGTAYHKLVEHVTPLAFLRGWILGVAVRPPR